MINKNNKTIKITLSKKQCDWLEQTSAKLGISKSKLIKWSLSNNIVKYLQSTILTQEAWEDLQRIVHTKWLDDWD